MRVNVEGEMSLKSEHLEKCHFKIKSDNKDSECLINFYP